MCFASSTFIFRVQTRLESRIYTKEVEANFIYDWVLQVHMHVCGGNGDCDGDGTRAGTGKCTCHDGFIAPICVYCKDHAICGHRKDWVRRDIYIYTYV